VGLEGEARLDAGQPAARRGGGHLVDDVVDVGGVAQGEPLQVGDVVQALGRGQGGDDGQQPLGVELGGEAVEGVGEEAFLARVEGHQQVDAGALVHLSTMRSASSWASISWRVWRLRQVS
jgi:hypothetical protein